MITILTLTIPLISRR